MAQFVRPSGDLVTDAAWDTVPYWSSLDEGGAGDAAYISATNTSGQKIAVSGSAVTDPEVSTDHVLRARHGKSNTQSGTNRLTLELRQGYVSEAQLGTLIATLLADVTMIDMSLVTSTHTLTSTEADAITDYGDLQFRLSVARDTGAGGRPHRIDFIELETPDAPAEPPADPPTGRCRGRIAQPGATLISGGSGN